jgi:hypothetical protein
VAALHTILPDLDLLDQGYTNNRDLHNVSKHFAEVLLRYDFWDSCEWWYHIKWLHGGLENLMKTGKPGILQRNKDAPPELFSRMWEDEFTMAGDEFKLEDILHFQEIRILWQNLTNLGRVYEEVCRCWYLPNAMMNPVSAKMKGHSRSARDRTVLVVKSVQN